MHSVEKIKEDHVVLKKKIDVLEKAINTDIERATIRDIFTDIESFWSEHEVLEEEFFRQYGKKSEGFPFTKMLIAEHKELKGHWHVIKDFLDNRSDNELRIALETDGQMIIDKFKSHIAKEDEYLNKYCD